MADFSNAQFDLGGKVAIVTGAGGRGNSIGRAYAVALANAGAAVVVADLNGEGARRVADEITAAGRQAIAVEVDIVDTDSVAAMVKAAEAAFGGVDILVNNAALMVEIADGRPLAGMEKAAFDKAIGVNVWGAINCTNAVVASMTARGGGAIVNQVSSGAYPAQSLYGVTKLALVGVTTSLATELGSKNIRVNAIAPGMTSTDAGKSITPDDHPFTVMTKMRCIIQHTDTPDALCGALLLLVSPAGRWMSGQTLHVDGGWVLRP